MNRLYPYGEAPLVMAHRGGGNEQPENSIVAFEAMRAQGFTYMETDAHVTSDGVALCCVHGRMGRCAVIAPNHAQTHAHYGRYTNDAALS